MNKTAEYLAALNADACNEYCRIKGIDFARVNPFNFSTPEDVMDCMVTFLNEGISFYYLFQKSTVWSIYVKSIAEERFHTALDMVLSHGGPADFIYYLRACYHMGFPAIADTDYDAIERFYLEVYPTLSFFNNQTYEDDIYPPLVKDAVKFSGVKTSGRSAAKALGRLNLKGNLKYADLNTQKSRSIKPAIAVEEAYEFWCKSPICRVHFSLKIDGVNTKIANSSDNGMELAISRGRAADSIDYTEAIRTFIQLKGINAKLLPGQVTGESFVSLQNLKIIQSHYPDKEYKTPKSTAMAMLRAPHNFIEDDLEYLTCCAFDYNGIKPNEAFKLLQEAGFSTPPSLEFAGEEIPRDNLHKFDDWMNKNVLDPLYQKGMELGIGSDGVVMYLLADIDTERKDKYSDSNIAIKYGPWSAVTYVSRVTNFLFDQRRVEASIVLEIEPCVTRDMNTATHVGIGSPDILISDNIRLGDEIVFERKSEAYNVYLKKKE